MNKLITLATGRASLGLVGALATGLSVGAEIDLVAYLVSKLFPRAAYGTAYGAIYGLFLLGGALGPALIGALFDATGSYRLPMVCAATLLGAAAALAHGANSDRAVADKQPLLNNLIRWGSSSQRFGCPNTAHAPMCREKMEEMLPR